MNCADVPVEVVDRLHPHLVRALAEPLDVGELLPRAQPVRRAAARSRASSAPPSVGSASFRRAISRNRSGRLRELAHASTPRASAVARCTTRTGALMLGAATQVHQAPRVGRDERLGRRARRAQLVVGHRQRDLRLAHGERAAEPAAEIRPRQQHDLRARSRSSSRRGCVAMRELAQHVARVVVGDAPSLVRGRGRTPLGRETPRAPRPRTARRRPAPGR